MDPLDEIRTIKKTWGDEVFILAHHYQRFEIADLGDRLGDSYELSKAAAEADKARFILFCGVRFMAEAAEILRRPEQRVIHPHPQAGCPMADMAPEDQAEDAFLRIVEVRGLDSVMPVVYMNSSAELKALVGRNGGTVCTSSNAPRAFQWAFSERPVVFFLPDEHLGRNTARDVGVSPEQVAVWNPQKEDGGLTSRQLARVRVILWKGYCHVHTAFTAQDMHKARVSSPQAQILVHPECTQEVVQLADGAGSTSFLVRRVQEAGPGSQLVIGTEVNLVARLARDYPDRSVLPLKRSMCPNMFRISPKRLLDSLRALPEGDFISLSEEVKKDARLALTRMLSI